MPGIAQSQTPVRFVRIAEGKVYAGASMLPEYQDRDGNPVARVPAGYTPDRYWGEEFVDPKDVMRNPLF